MQDVETDEPHDLVVAAQKNWHEDQQVLVCCQAAINRSGLDVALKLIRDGYEPKDAIHLMREKRGQAVLANRHFEK